MPEPANVALPTFLTGPLLRRLAPERLLIWLVATRPLDFELVLQPALAAERSVTLDGHRCRRIPIGRHAWIHMLDVAMVPPLPADTEIEYDLLWEADGAPLRLSTALPYLCHSGRERPAFVIASNNRNLLHGSCRKPHFDGLDGLVRADAWLAERLDQPEQRPAWLIMTGDQVYADDVAGPMLVAIHQLISRLGLFDEALEGATVPDSQALYAAGQGYYQREELLPDVASSAAVRRRFFGGARKPIFTSAHAHNHLITFAETMAMYLLVWSPEPWHLVDVVEPRLSAEHRKTFAQEREILQRFTAGLPSVARLLAHQPSLMIFDDHDVTDDWNLSAEWESTAYGHPLSKRIIGNALLAYLLCQAWGNAPDKVADAIDRADTFLNKLGSEGQLDSQEQDACIDWLLRYQGWEYEVPGTPHLLVLDTRTRRWRSERSPGRPSGLMDWEALTEMQQALLDKPSVVVVSPAPMFGVKLIEIIQKLFTLAGKPLLVDAENWMAHRGAAQVMLNIFRHSRTPGNYVVLSGDVHYSYVYDIRIRHRRQGPRIWQITSSGLKNAFPDTLLDWLDRLNRWLYAPWSPLNWLTKRRRMRITPRDPEGARAGERLWNGTGIGLVRLDAQGRPAEIRQLDARGPEVLFPPASQPGNRP
ncbi:alkaline phosphatase D family protein [Pseudomonas sp. OIL-1]|uniref:alkaline phosphatase D family protein n=1 Tax=Pseudomonas sp. OIL-1 TaxID=2706126 RepID=UPI0013A73617|nr:alkaline phosphatase D family protein [Pseudomonas sp. OIL-1]QIB50298.1 alkaline phosphatase family protein [Pseudomonas sp. OIL-1]